MRAACAFGYASKVETAFNNLVSCQQFLYAMVPAERRSSKYSYPVKGREWKISPHHYHGVNSNAYSKYKTIEMRMHCGTTQGNKINNWIKILIAIADAPLMASVPTTIDQLQSMVSMKDDVLEYMKKRIVKFRSQHKSSIPSAESPGTMPEIEEIIGTPADSSMQEASEVA